MGKLCSLRIALQQPQQTLLWVEHHMAVVDIRLSSAKNHSPTVESTLLIAYLHLRRPFGLTPVLPKIHIVNWYRICGLISWLSWRMKCSFWVRRRLPFSNSSIEWQLKNCYISQNIVNKTPLTVTTKKNLRFTSSTPVFSKRNVLNQSRTAKIHKDPSNPQLDQSPCGQHCAASCSFWTAHRHPGLFCTSFAFSALQCFSAQKWEQVGSKKAESLLP